MLFGEVGLEGPLMDESNDALGRGKWARSGRAMTSSFPCMIARINFIHKLAGLSNGEALGRWHIGYYVGGSCLSLVRMLTLWWCHLALATDLLL